MNLTRKTVMYCGFFPVMDKKVHFSWVVDPWEVNYGEDTTREMPDYIAITRYPEKHDPVGLRIEIEPALRDEEVEVFNRELKAFTNPGSMGGPWLDFANSDQFKEHWFSGADMTENACEVIGLSDFPAGKLYLIEDIDDIPATFRKLD